MLYLLNTEKFDDAFTDKINETEKKIFLSDKLVRGNKLSLCGRVLLGYALKKNCGIDSFTYRYEKNGKPYLENENIFFSISHSGDCVMCCLSDKEIGCDIEKIKAYNPKIAKRFFTAKEAQLLEKNEAPELIFSKLWTLKESILKKEGTGLNGGLDTYCFADYADKEEFSVYGCNFLSCRNGEYMIAVCSENKLHKPVPVDTKELEEYIDEINLKNT